MDTPEHRWVELRTRIRRFVGARLRNPDDADDVTQDVLLKLQGKLDDPAAGKQLPAWVFTAARNAVIDHYRARAVREPGGRLAVDESARVAADERTDARRQLAQCVSNMVDLLPEPYRTATRLADIEGLGHRELADRTGVTLTAAKSRVRRARTQLRGMILDCCRLERDAGGGITDYATTDRSPRYCGGGDPTGQTGGCGG